jgi:hypothetical protein
VKSILLFVVLSIGLIFTKSVFAQVKRNSFGEINNRVTPIFLDQSVNDFSMIDSLISQKSIIILSEDTHQDGATEAMRSEVIKYLIAKKGFTVLITESSLHETYFLNSGISDKVSVESFIDKMHNAYFTRKPVVNLLRYIIDSTKEKSIFIGGLDIEIQGSDSWEKLIKEVEAYPEMIKYISENKNDWAEFRRLVVESFGVGVNNNINNKWYMLIASCIGKIRAAINTIDIPYKLMKDKIWENLLNYARWTLVRPYVVGNKNGHYEKELSLFYSMRDSLMFENFKWLKANIIKGQKTIIVVSAYHSQKNYKSESGFATYMSPNSMTFGEYLSGSEFSNVTATFAFISSTGQRGAEYGGRLFDLPKMHSRSLEHFLFNQSLDHAFVNLRDLDFSFYMAPLHYSSYIKANWSKIFDGVFYNRVMYPNYCYDCNFSSNKSSNQPN